MPEREAVYVERLQGVGLCHSDVSAWLRLLLVDHNCIVFELLVECSLPVEFHWQGVHYWISIIILEKTPWS